MIEIVQYETKSSLLQQEDVRLAGRAVSKNCTANAAPK